MRGTVVVVCLFALALLVPSTSTAADPKPNLEERMLEQMNEVRAENGLRPFRLAPALVRQSKRYADALMAGDGFSHPTSLGSAGFSRVGETLAWHAGWSAQPGRSIRLWLASPGHRAIMLSSAYRYVGMGQARGRYDGSLATIRVARFGRR